MSKKNRRQPIPLRAQMVGQGPGPGPGLGQPRQIQIDPSDITYKTCDHCGHELFDVAYKFGVVSMLSPKNPTSNDIPVKTEVLICRACGTMFGIQPVIKQ